MVVAVFIWSAVERQQLVISRFRARNGEAWVDCNVSFVFVLPCHGVTAPVRSMLSRVALGVWLFLSKDARATDASVNQASQAGIRIGARITHVCRSETTRSATVMINTHCRQVDRSGLLVSKTGKGWDLFFENFFDKLSFLIRD